MSYFGSETSSNSDYFVIIEEEISRYSGSSISVGNIGYLDMMIQFSLQDFVPAAAISSRWNLFCYATGPQIHIVPLSTSNRLNSSSNSIIIRHGREISDILSLSFSPHSPILFSGHRNGSIYLLDTRTHPKTSFLLNHISIGKSSLNNFSSQKKNMHLKSNSSVSSLFSLNHCPYYLISGNLSDQVSLWDIRTMKSIIPFFHNESFHSKYHPMKPVYAIDDDLESTIFIASSAHQSIASYSLLNGHMILDPFFQWQPSTPSLITQLVCLNNSSNSHLLVSSKI